LTWRAGLSNEEESRLSAMYQPLLELKLILGNPVNGFFRVVGWGVGTQGDLINTPVQAKAAYRPVGKLKKVQVHCYPREQRRQIVINLTTTNEVLDLTTSTAKDNIQPIPA